nr:unnamed protein product [Callosobruchus analis]
MFSPLTRTGRAQAEWPTNDDRKNNNWVDLDNPLSYYPEDIEKVACTCKSFFPNHFRLTQTTQPVYIHVATYGKKSRL